MNDPDYRLLAGPAVLNDLKQRAQRLTRNRAEANDLVQDTLERGIRNYDRFTYGSLTVWLSRLMVHLFIDRCRKRHREVLRPDVAVAMAAPIAPPAPIWTLVSDKMLQEAIDSLDEPARDIFLKHEIEGLAYADISRQLAIPVATVGTRLHRARQKIRTMLVQEFERQEAVGD